MENNALYSTKLLKKFTSILAYSGKKRVVLRKVLLNLQHFWFHKQKTRAIHDIRALNSLFSRYQPSIETRKVRKGARKYDVPFLMKKDRARSLSLRWVVTSIRKQGGLGSFSHELESMRTRTGYVSKEFKALKDKVSKNFKFSHYRWK